MIRERLFTHKPHAHTPTNANVLHKTEQAAAGFNQRLAIMLTKAVGTMLCAYGFAVLAFIGLFGIIGVLPPVAILLVAWFSQTFLQLVFLPILSVGQSVLARKQELQADAQFNDVEATLHNISQIMLHLDAQDAEILRSSQSVEDLAKQVAQLINRVDMATGRGVV